MKKMLLMVALCLPLLAVSGALFAQAAAAPVAQPAPPPPPAVPNVQPGMGFMRPVPCIVPTMRLIGPLSARLNLSADQKTKVDALLVKADADVKVKIEDQAKAASAYVALLADPKASQTDVSAAAAKAMKAETDVLDQRIQTLFALKTLLNADQNKQLCEYLAEATIPWTDRIRPRPATPVAPAAAPAQPAK